MSKSAALRFGSRPSLSGYGDALSATGRRTRLDSTVLWQCLHSRMFHSKGILYPAYSFTKRSLCDHSARPAPARAHSLRSSVSLALVPVTGCVGWRGAVPSWGSSRLIGASPETQQRLLSSEFTSRLGGPSRCPQSFQRPSRCTPHSLTLLRPLAQERAPTRSARPVVALARLRSGRHVRRDVRPPPNSRPSLPTGLLLPTHLDASD